MASRILIADPPWEGKIQRPRKGTAYDKMADYPRLPLRTIQGQLLTFERSVDASLVFCIDKYLADELCRQSRFDVRRTIVWWKAHAGIGWNVRHAHEYVIARWSQGFRTQFNLPSVLTTPRTDHNFLTSKPPELLVTLVDAFAGKTGSVLEAYKGSSNLQRACEILGVHYAELPPIGTTEVLL